MTDDETLGGYFATHLCPPAFLGSDNASYSAEAYVDSECQEDGRYGAAVLFIRWSESGSQPDGHLETGYLAFGRTPEEAKSQIRDLTLLEVREHLDRLIDKSKERPAW
jgi:hypothetical protein